MAKRRRGQLGSAQATEAIVSYEVEPLSAWRRRICLAPRGMDTENGLMRLTTRQLETRLAQVERELAELKATVAGKAAKPWYREIVGTFAGDKAFAEIIRLGRLIRQGKLKG
jgi:hypothetical protein